MAFYPTRKTQSTLVWMLSTKMMPAVGVLIPLYILCQFFGVLDNIIASRHLRADRLLIVDGVYYF
jgi:sorbitol/mannitol transport system permease protein